MAAFAPTLQAKHGQPRRTSFLNIAQGGDRIEI
jgi:hypothetical protein